MSDARRQSTTAPVAAAAGAIPGLDVERVLPGRNRTKADVALGVLDGRRVAVKDYGPRPWWVRRTIGRFLIARERRAYRTASGVAGVPAWIGRPRPWTLIVERVDGDPLASLGSVPEAAFDRLDAILAGLHRHGVALGDLHHRDVLVASDGRVHVVDLATAWIRGRTPWNRALFRRWCDQDRIAAARLRARFLGGDETDAIAAVGARAAAWHRRGRRVRAWLDGIRGRR